MTGWWTDCQHFNSQPHEEADEFRHIEYIESQNISTHSLTKRLTDIPDWILQELLYFNSQPHEEADRTFEDLKAPDLHFNSQPHEEADSANYVWGAYLYISTHSLTKRLTYSSEMSLCGIFISTHSLTKRLTGCGNVVPTRKDISTHSLTKRLTM